jgi:hypothetical protein
MLSLKFPITRESEGPINGASPSKNLQKGIIPVLKISFPVTIARIPCSFASGIIQESPEFSALIALIGNCEWAFSRISLYFSLISGNLAQRLVVD